MWKPASDFSQYPTVAPTDADLVLIADESDDWKHKAITLSTLGSSAGRWELVVDPETADPPVPVTTPDGSDFVYAFVED